MVTVNSRLLYRRDALHVQLSKSDVIPLSFFKIKLAFSLIIEGKEFNVKRRQSLSDATGTKPKVAKVRRPQILPVHLIRYDSVGRWPAVKEQRRMRKKKRCHVKTNICSKSKVYPCLNWKQNFYVEFHAQYAVSCRQWMKMELFFSQSDYRFILFKDFFRSFFCYNST